MTGLRSENMQVDRYASDGGGTGDVGEVKSVYAYTLFCLFSFFACPGDES